MSKVLVTESHLEDIADAIRAKTGGSDTYTPGQMAAGIASIPTGGSAVLVSKTITENGTYDPADDDADGYDSVTVNVPSGGIPSGAAAPTGGSDGDLYYQTFPIPSNLAFVEYLDSTDTQYIDTGVYATQDIDITADIQWLNKSNHGQIGVRSGSWGAMTNELYIGTHTDGTNYISVAKSQSALSGSFVTKSGRATARTRSFSAAGKYWYVSSYDDTNYFKSSVGNAFTSNGTMTLFKARFDGTVGATGCIRIYRATIFDKGQPIKDYLPCLDTNGVPCMWDNVAGDYVYNDGTGDFLYGPTATPDPLETILWRKISGTWTVVG